MDEEPALRPIAGTPAEVQRLLAAWLSADAPAPLTVRTSGSTGAPKDVALSVRAVTASADATAERLGGAGQWVLALPVRYVAGLQVVVRSLLAETIPVILAHHASLADAVSALSHRRRYIALVPTQLYRMLESPSDLAALVELDGVLVGGSAASPELVSSARSAGVRVVTTYGMSETCGGCVYDGRPLSGVQVRIGSAGRILIAGPVLFDGYDGQPAATRAVVRDGWLHTADVGRVDDDGRLEVLGRLDDVVVSGGANVPLGVVQSRLSAHPDVAQAVVIGLPDVEWGTRVVAVVVPRRESAPTLAELRDFVGAAYDRSWAPRDVVVRPSLPMLESGKVDRQALTDELLAAHG